MKKAIVLFAVFFFVLVSAWSDVNTGGSLESRAWYSDESVSMDMLFRSWFVIPLGDEHDLNLQAALLTYQNGVSLTPEVNFSFFKDILLFGTNASFVLDSSLDELEVIVDQGMFINVLYGWKHFSFDVRGEHRFDYISSFPQNRGRINSNTYFHIREKEHNQPYPWTITIGPELEWRYAFNETEHYYRDIVTLGTRFEFKALSQGEDDEFPRLWNPTQSITLMNRWEQQEYGGHSFSWLWNQSIRTEFSISPADSLRIGAYANIPVLYKNQISHREQDFSIGLNIRVRLY